MKTSPHYVAYVEDLSLVDRLSRRPRLATHCQVIVIYVDLSKSVILDTLKCVCYTLAKRDISPCG